MAEVSNSKLLNTDAGIPKKNACIVLVKTEWNAAIVDELERGCKEKLQVYNVKKVITITVPGAFEIPFAIKNYWENAGRKKKPDPHFDYVCKAVTDGVVQLNLSLPVPTIFGVLTVDNEIQANERIGGIHGHKGEEAAVTAIKMINPKTLKGFK
jgi:6,7-dimethyl-8-ribityllumazine synthase